MKCQNCFSFSFSILFPFKFCLRLLLWIFVFFFKDTFEQSCHKFKTKAFGLSYSCQLFLASSLFQCLYIWYSPSLFFFLSRNILMKDTSNVQLQQRFLGKGFFFPLFNSLVSVSCCIKQTSNSNLKWFLTGEFHCSYFILKPILRLAVSLKFLVLHANSFKSFMIFEVEIIRITFGERSWFLAYLRTKLCLSSDSYQC